MLEGAEAQLFAIAITTIIDFYDDDDTKSSKKNLNYGCLLIHGRFESLSATKKFAVLEEVASSLLTNNSADVPEPDEYNDGAIYYVYRWLQGQFECVENGLDVWGEKIVAAYDECFPADEADGEDADGPRVSMNCEDESVWIDALEHLADRILWDRDFELYDTITPGSGSYEMMLPCLDISPTYFTRPMYFPNARVAKNRLRALTSSIAYPPEADVAAATTPND